MVPQDVDIIVLNANQPQESLKAELARVDPRFYLVRSKDPFASYKVLWYRLSNGRSCKVDVLQPGVMNIPSVEPEYIEHIDYIPLMPLSAVLLLKLQGWTDHRAASKNYLRKKQHLDVADIDSLLPIAARRGIKPREESWIPDTLIQASEERMKEYIMHFPSTGEQWRLLGFDVGNVFPALRQPLNLGSNSQTILDLLTQLTI